MPHSLFPDRLPFTAPLPVRVRSPPARTVNAESLSGPLRVLPLNTMVIFVSTVRQASSTAPCASTMVSAPPATAAS